MIIVAASGSEGNSKGSSEFASFSQSCRACSDGKNICVTDAQVDTCQTCHIA